MINALMLVPAPIDGTSYYRAMGPWSRLRRSRENLSIMFQREWRPSSVALADFAFLQRPWSENHYNMVEMLKSVGVPIWIDLDDNLFCVPTDNSVHAVYQPDEVRKRLASMIASADVLTVTTQKLATDFKPLNKKIRVIPNALDETLGYVKNRPDPDFSKKAKVVFWRGTTTHMRDLMSVGDVMIDIARAKPDWTFHFLGYNPWFITDGMGATQAVVGHGFPDAWEYMEYFIKLNPPITVVPLIDSAFNRAKSNCAWLEATLSGSAVIAPKLPEFEKPGVFTYSTREEFREVLTNAMEGKLDLQTAVKQSWAEIQERYLLKKGPTLARIQIIDELAAIRKKC